MSLASTPPRLDGYTLRAAYGRFPTGVVALCAAVEGHPVGMAVSSFVPVSLDPPLVAICIQSDSTTWPLLRRSRRLGLSVLARDQQSVARQLSAKNRDRFAGLHHVATATGAILIQGSELGFDCSVHRTAPAGDHELVLLRIENLTHSRDTLDPMIFHASRFTGICDPMPPN